MAPSNTVFAWGGLALVAAALTALTLIVLDMLRRARHERRRFALELEQLRAEIERRRRLAEKAPISGLAWQGWRRFRVQWKQRESIDSHSIYLVPVDGQPLPNFTGGQYLTIAVRLPGAAKPSIRCYSLSEAPREDYYRITVKKVRREASPVDSVSTYLNDVLEPGDVMDVKAPNGSFTLDAAELRPVVLLGAGIGVTPLACMASSVLATHWPNDLYLILGMRNSDEHPLKAEVEALAAQYEHLNLHVVYSQPNDDDRAGVDYHAAGRIDLSTLRSVLPSNNYEFFLCGPGSMMKELVPALQAWGVPESDVHIEAFGPASIPRATKQPEPAAGPKVTFAKSGVQATWTGQHANLLELAEAAGATVEAGCRSGACGTCETVVANGTVKASGGQAAPGACLMCVSTPISDVVLNT